MNQEKRQCQNCKQEFVIEPDDFTFYEKMGGISTPKNCPKCRSQFRLCFRNERFFYKRKCDNCKKDTISMFSADKPFPVWCYDCWWSNDLDPLKYGMDYDLGKPFLEQFNELWNKVPKPALVAIRSVNSQYLNYAADNKNCYMIIESSNNENCINCYWIQLSKDLTDCFFTNKVELSYEVDNCFDSNKLRWSKGCYNCLDSFFLLDCRGCTNCLGCINLRQKQFYIFNKPYSKEEYFEKIKYFKLDTFSGVENFKKEFANFIKDKPRKFAEITNAVNSTGNYMSNVKNNRACFHAYEAEECAYSIHVWRGAKDCVDCNTAGRTAELLYNTLNTGIDSSNVICGFYCWTSQFMGYCLNCPGSNHLFGCVGMRDKSYCILNKQYTKEEYEILREKIISQMKIEGDYGSFYPAKFSPLGYNESSAFDEFPLSKEEALAQGFKWEDTERGTYGKETINWDNFFDSIKELPENFNPDKEIFVCKNCKKNYRIIKDELAFYRRLYLPIPRNCPECRHTNRLKERGPNKLWHRNCMKPGCTNEFETSYASDRPEIIYCESCYNAEVA